MKLKIWWFLIALAAIWMIYGVERAFADQQLQWQVPYVGLINLDLTTTEALVGYDAILRQAVGGASLPVWTDPKGIIALQVGAVAPWPNNNEATIEPYIAAGHDILKEIPGLNQYKTIHLNIFGRYATDEGKAGVGVSLSYSFASGS